VAKTNLGEKKFIFEKFPQNWKQIVKVLETIKLNKTLMLRI
jgi:hypothetical protein